ncbi:clan AA aspartic protease [Candidatus Poribacteria bacterium]|nr:MAG: clan AA aspartic protease [Candidatus Poribacteria bacterium]
MRHTARIELANNDELVLANAGVMNPEDVRRITVEDALVDTGATRLGLPPSLIEQLGLTPFRSEPVRTVNGLTELWIYSPVQFRLLERESITTILGVPEGTPALIGHILLEDLDLCLDIKKGLIYNPAHDGKWMTELY